MTGALFPRSSKALSAPWRVNSAANYQPKYLLVSVALSKADFTRVVRLDLAYAAAYSVKTVLLRQCCATANIKISSQTAWAFSWDRRKKSRRSDGFFMPS